MLFDIIALTLVGVSMLVGLARGALREVTAIVAFFVAAFVSLFTLRFTGPIALRTVHPSWAANGVAIVVVFAAVYIAARSLSAGLGRSVHNTKALGTLDRLIGAGLGALRGLVLLGAFTLVFTAARPADRAPLWISKAKLYPVAEASGVMLRTLAPKGLAMADDLTPSIRKAVGAGATDRPLSSATGQTGGNGYDAAARGALDDVVERSR